MSTTTFSGPVVSTNGFDGAIDIPVSLTSELPAASAANLGQLRAITDNGAGDNEFAVVISNGTAWLAISTAALS